MKIMFYTGPQCSLCDLAMTQLSQTKQFAELDIESKNIREDSHLYHLYAVRIPVIKRVDNENEIGWPFTTDDLEVFLS